MEISSNLTKFVILIKEGFDATLPGAGNLVLQVTLYTSLKPRGRTAELPGSRFAGQVMRFTRHALRMFTLR